jgi:hypothetical protein
MSNRQFINKTNVNMLWEVINDEDIFKFLTKDIQEKIYQIFLNNIQKFFESEKLTGISLVEMNKKYILLILNFIKQNYPYQPSKIKIHNESPIKELITYEEIQNDRKVQFEKDYNQRQEEFESFINVKTPPLPEFTEKQTDKPIKEIDKILKDMLAQRNYEVEQINKTYNTNTNQVDNWLKPQETSLKNQKLQVETQNETRQTQIIKNGIIENETEYNTKIQNTTSNFFNNSEDINSFKSKKNVSWSGNSEIFNMTELNEDEEDNNIFLKLKKIDDTKYNDTKYNDTKYNDTKYNDTKYNDTKYNDTKYNDTKYNENIIGSQNKIIELEKNIKSLNEKMDKILNLLTNK